MSTDLSSHLPCSLTILPTYRCPAACRNCCFNCSPKVDGYLPKNRILKYIEDAASIPSIKLIVFSGGECFLLKQDLDEVVSVASSLEFRTRCVTNAFWATSKTETQERLRALANNGLKELNISTGDYHQKWIPIENVVRAATEAVQLGMNVAIVVEVRDNRNYTLKKLTEEPEISDILNDKTLVKNLLLIESPWITNNFHRSIACQDAAPISKKNVNHGGGCTSVLSTLVISPSEYLGACCGLTHEQIPEMRLGDLRKYSITQLIESGKQDFLKVWLMIEGPHEILRWAAEKDSHIRWGDEYVHHCDVCRRIYSDQRIRRVIMENYQEKLADILFRFTLFDRVGLQN